MSKATNEASAGLDARMKEAEVYYSMGLLEEALSAYESMLSEVPDSDEEMRKGLEDRLQELRGEMDKEVDATATEDMSTQDLSFLRKAFRSDDNSEALLESARAFQELGLYNEAVAEWEKLLKNDYPLERLLPEIKDYLHKTKSPKKVLPKIERLIDSRDVSSEEKARITSEFASIMEQRGQEDTALDLYREAVKLAPDNRDLRSKLDTVKTGLSLGSRYDFLLRENLVTASQLQQALSLSKRAKKSVEHILVENLQVPKEQVGKSLSLFYGCQWRTYDSEIPTPVELIQNLKKAFLMQDQWVPLAWEKDAVEILVDDPNDLNKTDHIRALIRAKKIVFSVGFREDIEMFIKAFFGGKTENSGSEESSDFQTDEFEMLPDISFEEEEEAEEIDEMYDEASGQVVKLVDQVLVAAYRKNISDIHVEPSPITRATTIRFRQDGVCQEYLQVPNSMARGILSRLKIMADLDIAERRLPQDGKIKFKRKGIPPFELRLATLPTAGGFEDAVLRILAKSGAMKLEDMGLSLRNLEIMQRILTQPYGLVLVVGPTGSGKTTSLHAALGHINKPGIKIWTAEDPIEITQAGLRQVEVKPKIGLNFARIMRAFLRADPDVIMIGEMRDQETASIGIEASLTGHLVFSTLHTNSAPETVTRLLDMGLNPLNFSDAFLGVLAQRLVRRLCSNCREAYHPSREEFDELAKEYDSEALAKAGIEYTSDLTLYRPKGCERCSGTGYKGRMAIHELLNGTKEIKRMIKRQANTEDLFRQGIEDGMSTLRRDGMLKAFQGLTDFDEVRRVCVA